MDTVRNFDRAAAAFSLSCVAHCLALPALAIALPIFAATAEAEWIHWLLTLLAVVASGTVVVKAHDGRQPSFLIPAAIGITLISGALFAENFGIDETPPTVIGGILLAAAHTYRIIKHR